MTVHEHSLVVALLSEVKNSGRGKHTRKTSQSFPKGNFGAACDARCVMRSQEKGTKKVKKILALVLAVMMMVVAAGCGGGDQKAATSGSGSGSGGKQITMGFSQIGAESEWRTANTESIKKAAEEAGVNLQFSDAQQKQENQIKAIRSFIAQGVDIIAFVPIVETGWDTVLKEAKDANIPVIVVDRDVKLADDSLYVAKIGTDSVTEGKNVF